MHSGQCVHSKSCPWVHFKDQETQSEMETNEEYLNTDVQNDKQNDQGAPA